QSFWTAGAQKRPEGLILCGRLFVVVAYGDPPSLKQLADDDHDDDHHPPKGEHDHRLTHRRVLPDDELPSARGCPRTPGAASGSRLASACDHETRPRISSPSPWGATTLR